MSKALLFLLLLCFGPLMAFSQISSDSLTILQKAKEKQPINKEVVYRLARGYFDNGSLDLAKKEIEELIKLDHAHLRGLFLQGLIYEELEEYEEASKVYVHIIEHYPKIAEAWSNLGHIQAIQKEYEKALKSFTKAIKYGKGYNDYAARAEVYYYRGEIKKASKDIGKSLNYREGTYNLFIAARIYVDKQAFDEAIQCYQKLIILDSTDIDSYIEWSMLLAIELEKYTEGLDVINKALKINENDAEAWNTRGRIHGMMERYPSAIKDFTTAINLVPDDAYLYMNRADIYFLNYQLKKAFADYTEAILIDDSEPMFYEGRALTLLDLERTDDACKDYNMSLELGGQMNEAFNDACQ